VDEYDALAQSAIERQRVFAETWFTVTAVLPLETRVMWEEVLLRFQQMGVSHDNPEVHQGMVIEYLMAEWYASASSHAFDYGAGT